MRKRGEDRSSPSARGHGGGASVADFGNTYGLSVKFLDSLGIDGPLHTRVFVANLSYDVDEKKLKERVICVGGVH